MCWCRRLGKPVTVALIGVNVSMLGPRGSRQLLGTVFEFVALNSHDAAPLSMCLIKTVSLRLVILRAVAKIILDRATLDGSPTRLSCALYMKQRMRG
jgi:hypothetical protein